MSQHDFVDFKPQWMRELSEEDRRILDGFTHSGTPPPESPCIESDLEQMIKRICAVMGWNYAEREQPFIDGALLHIDNLRQLLDRLSLIPELCCALRHMHDAQNGPPLLRSLVTATARTRPLLEKVEPLIEHLVCPRCRDVLCICAKGGQP